MSEKIMWLYHGSDVIVKKPRIIESNRLLDFGTGFYTTTNKNQAIRWSQKVMARNNSESSYLSVYKFQAEKEIKIKKFEKPDKEWLDFITANRNGTYMEEEYDIIWGPVADDNVYLTVKLFETGVLSKEEALKRLKVEKLFDQVLFHSEKALKCCEFYNFEIIGGDVFE
ncbi:MAG: DUF3990 domain-containing protein [Tissierellales bacterium]|jgi:hypothetical protein|nr:DUF3990 domain-containing protein [Tissierellales bacterium]